MDVEKKLSILGASAKYDICSAACGSARTLSGADDIPAIGSIERSAIYHSVLPDGRPVSLFKVLMSNHCLKNCFYCANRRDANFTRSKFTCDELAKIFIEFYKRNYVEGLFLSSAVCSNPDYSMDQMIKTVEIVRFTYNYRGYIHLKILPGSSDAHVEYAMKLANRVSINLEAPTTEHVKRIAPDKDFKGEILSRVNEINKNIHRGVVPNAGYTTQFVVGAADESDRDILKMTSYLYGAKGLTRAYYSAFVPAAHTPLEHHKEVPLAREHRLYQADWLLNFYGFRFDEIPFDAGGNLSLERDPKFEWAVRNFHLFPVEVNRAGLHQLMRVPGIGRISARRIVKVRKEHSITSLTTLAKMGVVTKRAQYFVTLNGKTFSTWENTHNVQLSLY